MEDLANERAAVVDALHDLNMEPVNAESVLPTGRTSWAVIEREISSCDIFVLVVGDRYGWIPTDGPFAGQGKSVTHLEYDSAKRADLPILPFFKKLKYTSAPATDDAKARDAFREEIGSWDTGHFRTEFELAKDLAPSVVRSIIQLLMDDHQEVAARRRAQPTPAISEPDVEHVVLPSELLAGVRNRLTVLVAGAGMSLQAGLPSAYAFTEALVEKIRQTDPAYERAAHGGDLNDIATDLEKLLGSAALREAVTDVLGFESTVEPSLSQLAAVRGFDLVVTTNYDTLIERADTTSRLPVIGDEISGPLPGVALVKLHGSLTDPGGLVLTAEDIREHGNRRRRLIEQVRSQVATRPVIVVGSSLRDETTEDLFSGRSESSPRGWAVAPTLSEVYRLRLRAWNLQPIEGTADAFFASLAETLGIGDDRMGLPR